MYGYHPGSTTAPLTICALSLAWVEVAFQRLQQSSEEGNGPECFFEGACPARRRQQAHWPPWRSEAAPASPHALERLCVCHLRGKSV